MTHKQRIYLSMQHLTWVRGFNVRLLNTMPFFHMTAQTYMVTLALLGQPSFQHQPFDPKIYLKMIERERITATNVVPTMIEELLDHPAFSKTNLSSLELIMYGAQHTPLTTIERMRRSFPPQVRFSQSFGQTEMGIPIILDKEGHEIRPGSVGRPNVFCDVRIMKENGEEAKPGEVGEIVVRSPSLMLGYFKHPEATKEFFKYGPDWGRMGDMGFMDEDCFVTLAARKKDMYISGGENVYPVEIEEVIRQHPAVLEAAVIGIPDKKWGEVGAAAIVVKPQVQVTEEEIINHCQSQLAKFKCPKWVRFYDSLPKNALGKIVKGEIYPDFADFIK